MADWQHSKTWKDQGKPVFGHLCDGLRQYQAAGGGCTPLFNKDGETDGCDDTNMIAIIYCPFCGVQLRHLLNCAINIMRSADDSAAYLSEPCSCGLKEPKDG